MGTYRSPWIKSRVSNPGSGFLSSATWPLTVAFAAEKAWEWINQSEAEDGDEEKQTDKGRGILLLGLMVINNTITTDIIIVLHFANAYMLKRPYLKRQRDRM